MTRPPKYTVDQVVAALNEKRGLITHAADVLGCEPDTVRAYVKRHKRIAATLRKWRTRRVDNAELSLDKAIARGEPWAVALTLRTLGHKRGYSIVTRSELTGKSGGPIETKDVSLTDEERANRITAILDAARARRDRPADSDDSDAESPADIRLD